MSIGCESRSDHAGSRSAKGEFALKFVVKVNVAREVRTPWLWLALHLLLAWEGR